MRDIMKRLLPLLLLSLLMGQSDCESAPQGGYCKATDDALNFALTGEAIYNTIIGGTPSVKRRSTVYVYMPGKGSCTGVVIGKRTVLTAAHCHGDNGHRVYLARGDSKYWVATGSLRHPGYLSYLSSGNVDLEGRKADLMLLYFGEDLPQAPPEDQVLGFYKATPLNVSLCESMIAQGFGQTEDDPAHPCPASTAETAEFDALAGAKCLREGPYSVRNEEEKQLYTRHAVIDPVAICFGDSGGPLYVRLTGQPGLQVAGITSTTSSSNCIVASHHTKVAAFEDWVLANYGGPEVAGTL